jgi:small subunit ribosomal protein S4
MGRYTGPVCRLCRRVGEKLMLKGERCESAKCAIDKKAAASGPRGRGGRRPPKFSDYGLRLREKQKARYSYGVLERQFRRTFAEAEKTTGMTGETLAQLLERRLDNTVYRLGYSDSRNQARQLVRHGHVMVNGKKVDIPSFVVKPGDAVTWKGSSVNKALYNKAMERIEARVIPSWLSLDKKDLSGRVLSLPVAEEITTKFDKKMVVEHYSR